LPISADRFQPPSPFVSRQDRPNPGFNVKPTPRCKQQEYRSDKRAKLFSTDRSDGFGAEAEPWPEKRMNLLGSGQRSAANALFEYFEFLLSVATTGEFGHRTDSFGASCSELIYRLTYLDPFQIHG
jgi:hypothetical protein